jgi:hypothetical protein
MGLNSSWGGKVGEDETSDSGATWQSMQKFLTPDTAGSIEQSQMLNQGLGVTNMKIVDPSQAAEQQIPNSGTEGTGLMGMLTGFSSSIGDAALSSENSIPEEAARQSGMMNEQMAALNGQGSYKNYQKLQNRDYHIDEQGRLFLNKDVVDLQGYTGGTAIKRSGIY